MLLRWRRRLGWRLWRPWLLLLGLVLVVCVSRPKTGKGNFLDASSRKLDFDAGLRPRVDGIRPFVGRC